MWPPPSPGGSRACPTHRRSGPPPSRDRCPKCLWLQPQTACRHRTAAEASQLRARQLPVRHRLGLDPGALTALPLVAMSLVAMPLVAAVGACEFVLDGAGQSPLHSRSERPSTTSPRPTRSRRSNSRKLDAHFHPPGLPQSDSAVGMAGLGCLRWVPRKLFSAWKQSVLNFCCPDRPPAVGRP
jgi:hypothetical protein